MINISDSTTYRNGNAKAIKEHNVFLNSAVGTLIVNLNSSNKCNSKELTREASCVKWQPQKLVKRKRGAHGLLYTANPGRKISHISIM